MKQFCTHFYNLLQLVTSLQSIPLWIDLCSSYNMQIDPLVLQKDNPF